MSAIQASLVLAFFVCGVTLEVFTWTHGAKTLLCTGT